MGRAKTSGREDDNKESIVKRFREFTSTKILLFYGVQAQTCGVSFFVA